MATFFWVVYSAVLGTIEFWLMNRQLTRRERVIFAGLVLAGLAVASYSGYSEYRSGQEITELKEGLQQQTSELKEKQAYSTGLLSGQLKVIGQIDAKSLELLLSEKVQIAQKQAASQDSAALVGIWPRLDNTQKQTLVTGLKSSRAGVSVECNDFGCAGLRDDLIQVFHNAGWQANGGPSINAVATGIFIEGPKGDRLVQTLREQIQRVTGFSIGYVEESHFAPEPVRMAVIIGVKPSD